MPSPEEERFEMYLKQFRPIATPPLRLETSGGRMRHFFLIAAPAAAAVMIALAVTLHIPLVQTTGVSKPRGAASTAGLENRGPLTLGSANALLATAPSFPAVLDDMWFHPAATPPAGDKTSAFSILSKEKSKL